MFTKSTTPIAVLLLLALWLAAPAAKADTLIVVPGAQTNSEGNDDNAFPFSIGLAGIPTQRYQQVYAASSFSALTGPSLLTQIIFRPDATNGNAFASTLPDIQINLSTTAAAPDALSTTFSNNVGANDTIVYNRGALTLSSSDTAGPGGSRNFDIIITLTTPFLYNPAQGNLLLDVRNFGDGRTTQFDAQTTTGDAVSRVFTFGTGNVNSLTANGADTLGLVTQFNFAPAAPAAVPEPTTMLLLGTGLAGIAAKVRRRRKQ